MSFLHTWGDSLIWHPHIHMLMPAVAINDAGDFVYPNNSAFLFPVHAMSAVFKAEFLKALRKALPGENIPYFDKKYKWVEYCEGVKQDDAKHVIDYLGRYFNRTAISEQRLLSFDDQGVSFSYRKERKGNEAKIVNTMTLKRDEFFRRFLQHVPWKGMHRVRYYGFLHPSQKRKLQRMQLVLCDSKFIVELSEVEAQLSELRKQDWICCSKCGSQMKISHTLNRFQAFVNLRAPPCAI